MPTNERAHPLIVLDLTGLDVPHVIESLRSVGHLIIAEQIEAQTKPVDPVLIREGVTS